MRCQVRNQIKWIYCWCFKRVHCQIGNENVSDEDQWWTARELVPWAKVRELGSVCPKLVEYARRRKLATVASELVHDRI